jgi:hypothetical protein
MTHNKPLMSLLVISAAAFVPSLQAAQAASPEEGSSILYCTPSSSDFRIASSEDKAPAQAYTERQTFDANALINIDPKIEMRTGTATKELQCGDIVIEVRGGFYNANPQGELGAAEDFAKLTIVRRANRVEVSLVADSCADAQSARAQMAWGPNPVQAVEGRRVGGAYQITLFKSVCAADGNSKPATHNISWP